LLPSLDHHCQHEEIADFGESYPYSTLFFKYQEFMRLPFVLEKILPPHAFEDFEDLNELKWINQKFEKREAESIRCGLQKTIFAYERDRATGRPIEPVVNHPKKKTQEELWREMFPDENLELRLLSYEG
jgi:hypothetical protein